MRKIGMALCAVGVVVAAPLHAAGVIAVEKLPADQVAKTIQAASDDTAIEIKGQTKTKAQWRSYFQANLKQPDAAQIQALAAQAKAKSDADAKALQDQQDQDVATQNAQTEKEFEALSAQ